MKSIVIIAAPLALLAVAGTPRSSSAQSGQPPIPAVAHPPAPADNAVAPALTDAKPRDYAGLHNVVAYSLGFYSGSVPEGDRGFDTLARMGIKTIISVDGAEPAVAEAKSRGIRYIHLPIGYNGFDEQRKLELARATRDAMKDGPVYIHCHHGKHRSAGAAAAIAASLGWITPEEGVERMKVSGTAPNYKGLYTCAMKSAAVDAAVIDAVPANFPEVSRPAGLVKSMIEIDDAFELLKLIEKSAWAAPADHPDLVPAAEAGRIADLYRLLETNDRVKAKPAEFMAMLNAAGSEAQVIEDLLGAPQRDVTKLSAQFKLIAESCKGCHAKYRD